MFTLGLITKKAAFSKTRNTCLSFSLSLLIIFLNGYPATAQKQESDFIFRVKVAASKIPISKTSKLYKDFPDLEAIEFPDGYIRYFVGKYETFHRAKELLPSVHEKGYNDAYVVCIHDGEILTGNEAIMKIYGGN